MLYLPAPVTHPHMPARDIQDMPARDPSQLPPMFDEDGAYTGETRVIPRPQPPHTRRQPARRRRSIRSTLRWVALAVAGVLVLAALLIGAQAHGLAQQIGIRDARPAPVV